MSRHRPRRGLRSLRKLALLLRLWHPLLRVDANGEARKVRGLRIGPESQPLGLVSRQPGPLWDVLEAGWTRLSGESQRLDLGSQPPEDEMKRKLSIDEVLARLEAQAAFHRERESFHAGHEARHREQRSTHAADLENINRRLDAFRAAAAEALDLADRAAVPADSPSLKEEDLGSASRPKVIRMAELVLENKNGSERFGPVGLAEEVNQRFGERLRRPVTAGEISTVLRRLHYKGQIHLVRRGRPHWEALYVRVAPAG